MMLWGEYYFKLMNSNVPSGTNKETLNLEAVFNSAMFFFFYLSSFKHLAEICTFKRRKLNGNIIPLSHSCTQPRGAKCLEV